MKPLLILVLVLSPLFAFSQTLEIKAVFASDTLSVLEPWTFYVSIKNTSDSAVSVCRIINQGREFLYGNITMEIKHDTSDTWLKTKSLLNKHYERVSRLESQVQLLPDEEHHSGMITIEPPFKQIHLEPETGYSVRILYDPLFSCGQHHKKTFIYSPRKLFFQKISDEDALLYKHLQSLKNGDYFYPSYLYMGADTAMIKDAEFVLRTFPNSTFIDYFHLFLCYSYNDMAIYSKKDIPKCLGYLRKAKYHGHEALKSNNTVILERAEFLLASFAHFVNSDVFPHDFEDETYKEFLYPLEKRKH
jgi:hypothetical protein